MKKSTREAIKLTHKQALINKAAQTSKHKTMEVSSPEKDIIDLSAEQKEQKNSEKERAFQVAANQFCKLQNWSEVTRKLLFLNVAEESAKDVPSCTEEVLEAMGFTNDKKVVGKIFLTRREINDLLEFLLESYQNICPSFASIEDAEWMYPKEVESIAKASHNKLITYIAIQACFNQLKDEESIKLLTSGSEKAIIKAFYAVKCSGETKNWLYPLAKQMGNLAKAILEMETKEQEAIKANYSVPAFANLNPKDYPSHFEKETPEPIIKEKSPSSNSTTEVSTSATAEELLETLQLLKRPELNIGYLDMLLDTPNLDVIYAHKDDLIRLRNALSVSLDWLCHEQDEIPILEAALKIAARA